MVSPGVDGYTVLTPRINGKYSEKRKKTTPYYKPIERILKLKYKLSGGVDLHLGDQGSQIAPLPSRQLPYCSKHLKILIKQK